MKLICGLGNPGQAYEKHRHNVGFRVVEALVQRLRLVLDHQKFEACIAQGTVGSEKVLLMLPQTFMNLSGQSLATAARFYKVAPDDVLVIHDELDLPLGRLQLKKGGGSGGHNGLNSILESWGEDGFARLRVGIGKPESKEQVVGYVLTHFRSDELTQLEEVISRAAEAAHSWVQEGLSLAMNRFNRREPPPKSSP